MSFPAREGILTTVGNTPLIRLSRLSPHLRLFAKLEMFNPGGSIKDRAALEILCGAFERGEICPGTTIIESSSGNLGIGLAQVCLRMGLKLIYVVAPPNHPSSYAVAPQTYGATVDRVEDPDPATGDYLPARIRRVQKLLSQVPGSFWCHQYANLDNPRAHVRTMEEISGNSARRRAICSVQPARAEPYAVAPSISPGAD